MFSFDLFPTSKYEPDYSQNFGTTKYFVFYAAKTSPIILVLLGMLQPPFFKLFPNVRNYNNNKNI